MGEVKRKQMFIDAWCQRMKEKYGSLVIDRNGVHWPWRKALRREAHGTCAVEPTSVTNMEIECAKAWEGGFWPHWAKRS